MAIDRASAAGPDEIVKFMVAMSEPFFTDQELEFLRHDLGMEGYMHTCHWAQVGIPARCLLTLAEMKPVIRVG